MDPGNSAMRRRIQSLNHGLHSSQQFHGVRECAYCTPVQTEPTHCIAPEWPDGVASAAALSIAVQTPFELQIHVRKVFKNFAYEGDVNDLI